MYQLKGALNSTFKPTANDELLFTTLYKLYKAPLLMQITYKRQNFESFFYKRKIIIKTPF